MQRIAIIDVGSNSARLVITHIYKSGAYNMVYNQKEALRLSQKVENGILLEQAFKDTLECMQNFATMCKLFYVDKIVAVATAAVRNAKNGKELTALVEKETGIHLHILSGKAEAYASYVGVINTLEIKDGIIFDLGGGSTELVLFHNRQIVDAVSLPLGCVNLTDMFNTKDKMPASVFSDISYLVMSTLGRYPWLKNSALPLIGVGGTVRTLAKIEQKKIKYPSSKIHNFQFSAQAFKTTFKMLRDTTLDERKKISGLGSDRADLILAGSSVVQCLLETTNSKKFIISGCGIREGLFIDYYSKQQQIPLIAEDILADSTRNLLSLYATDATHSEHITALALTMFDAWSPLHKLNASWRRLLKTAALLHDIGITINYYSHARHSAYMIENAKLFGLTHKEQVITALVAGWHNGISKSLLRSKPYRYYLSDEDLEKVSKLALFLALAESMDYSQTMQITKVIPTIKNKKTAVLAFQSPTLPSIELHQLKQQIPWFQKVFDLDLYFEPLPVTK
ncbi:MAG TPA: Ppx/GppA family phosphatase [Candidatus Avacidaminococcus intestinavium]|uniref:Ppx/GppA family phosphatase n=1 Tax=Candidatus Avacidaminococcus intestinavium TaxID=2840684 RepID=A0A9D1MPV6_9FIRM|nr:Ppx/GppA family phosphatase [Candidatus Avacidaminococcus intestinavium]